MQINLQRPRNYSKTPTERLSGRHELFTDHEGTQVISEDGHWKRGKYCRPKITLKRSSSYTFSKRTQNQHYSYSEYRHYNRHVKNQQFVTAKFRFYALEQDALTWSRSTTIPWNAIQKVIVNSDGTTFCPICLESELCCPVVTTCGHVFCGACFLHSLHASNEENDCKHWGKCPCCHKNVGWNNTKFCQIYKKDRYEVGDELSLLLLTREENEVRYEFATKTKESGFSDQHWETNFSRVRILRDVDKLFQRDIIDLRRQIISGHPVHELPYLVQVQDRVLGLINRIKADMKAKAAEPPVSPVSPQSSPTKEVCFTSAQVKNPYYTPARQLYQSYDGQNYFMESLNWKCLKHEFGNDLPPTITGRIVERWSMVLTEEERYNYRFLKHLPLLSDVYFVEIDLNHLLSPETLEIYGPIIEERQLNRIRVRQQGDIEKDAAIRKEEQDRIVRLKELCRRPFPIDEWRIAPKISDQTAFPSLGMSGAVRSSRKQRSKRSKLQSRQAARQKRQAAGQKQEPIIKIWNKPSVGSWGKRPKIGIRSNNAETTKLLKIQAHGASKEKKVDNAINTVQE
jgi:hypothetical protein